MPDPTQQLDEILARCEKATAIPATRHCNVGFCVVLADLPRLAKALRAVLEDCADALECPVSVEAYRQGLMNQAKDTLKIISAALGGQG